MIIFKKIAKLQYFPHLSADSQEKMASTVDARSIITNFARDNASTPALKVSGHK